MPPLTPDKQGEISSKAVLKQHFLKKALLEVKTTQIIGSMMLILGSLILVTVGIFQAGLKNELEISSLAAIGVS